MKIEQDSASRPGDNLDIAMTTAGLPKECPKDTSPARSKKRKLCDPFDAKAIAERAVYNVLGNPEENGQSECDSEFGKNIGIYL